MLTISTSAVVPLIADREGTIRVRGTRVTLDSIIMAFQNGATAEAVAQKFPPVTLADVYQVIAYYLHHSAEIDNHLALRRAEAAPAIPTARKHGCDPTGGWKASLAGVLKAHNGARNDGAVASFATHCPTPGFH